MLHKNQGILTFFVILISLIYGLPHLILSSQFGSNYSPLELNEYVSRTTYDEFFYYSPLVNIFNKGNLTLADPYVYEYKNYASPYVGETLSALIILGISKLTSFSNSFLVSDFIFPPIIFVLFYYLAKFFISNNLFAIATAFITSVSRDYISVIPYPAAIQNYFKYGEGLNHFLYLSRAFHPQISTPLLLITIISTLLLIKKPTFKKAITLGILIGLSFYTYLFNWSFLIFFVILVGIYLFIRGDINKLKLLVISFILGLAIGSFYMMNIFNFLQSNIASDFFEKSSILNITVNLTLFRYLFIGILFYLVTKSKKLGDIFTLTIFAGILIPLVVFIIIGKDLESTHYLRRIVIPLSSIAFFTILYYVFSNIFKLNMKSINSLAIVLVGLFLIFAVKTQVLLTQKNPEAYQSNKDLVSLINYLNVNEKNGDVIGSLDSKINSYTAVKTKAYVFFPPSDRTIMPTSEGLERYVVLSRLLGISKDDQKKDLDKKMAYIYHFQSFNENVIYKPVGPKRKEAEQRIDELASRNIKSYLDKYRLNYIVVSPEEIDKIDPDMELLKLTATVNGYLIFNLSR